MRFVLKGLKEIKNFLLSNSAFEEIDSEYLIFSIADIIYMIEKIKKRIPAHQILSNLLCDDSNLVNAHKTGIVLIQPIDQETLRIALFEHGSFDYSEIRFWANAINPEISPYKSIRMIALKFFDERYSTDFVNQEFEVE